MKKILVIEDNSEVRENIEEILTLSNYEVVTAENGKVGAEIALAEKPDLIICDIMMPVLDGFGVLHLLNKREEVAGTPFIFLTAKSEKGDFRRGMEMGADDYITKPFEGIDLLNAVESRLKKLDQIKKNFNSDSKGISDFIDGAQQNGYVKLTSEEREVCHYPKKHLLYAEGQRPKQVYYVESGKVKTFLTNETGKDLITHIYGTGDFFGYMAILEEMNYRDNAQVLEDADLMLIPRADFMNLMLNDAHTSREFIKIIAHNIVSDEQNLLNLAYNSLRKKVGFGLIKLYDKYKMSSQDPVEMDISRENMAATVGVATESLIRTLSDFREEKLIDIHNGKIIIINEKKLRDLPY